MSSANSLGTRYYTAVWFLLWFGLLIAAGFVVVRVHENDVPLGFGLALLGGQFFAWFASIARRRLRERGMVRLYLRSWSLAPLWCTLWFGGALIGSWAFVDDLYSQSHHDSSALLGAGAMILGGLFARIASGPGRRFLRADVSAGVVEYVNGADTTTCSLDELGPLDITEKSPWYHLTAPGLPNRVLYDSLTAKDVQNLQAHLQVQLDRLHDQSAVRRILAETPTEGSAFRAAPELVELVRAAVDDPRRLHAALVALENDRDAEIGRKAAELRRDHLVAVTRTVDQRERAMEPRLGSRAFAALWLLLWFAAVLAGGYVIVHLELLRDDLAGMGFLMAAAMGALFSWIGSVGRRLQQERRAIRLELRGWALAPLWCTLGFGLALVASWAFFDELRPFSGRHDLAALAFYLLVMLLGGLFARACSGPSKEYLRVDTDAGVVEYVHRGAVTACPLDKLGRFEIVKVHSGAYNRRNRVTHFQLVAPGLPDRILYDSIYPTWVTKRQASLQQRVDQLRDELAKQRATSAA